MPRRGTLDAMTDVPTNDPYGALRESWPIGVLNGASQGANIVFRKAAIRPMPLLDQKTFPDAAHFEICGFDELCCCAYAVGYVEDVVATLHTVLADARALGYNPGVGSDTGELIRLAQRQNWDVYEDDSPSGDLDARLATQGLVGLAALNTSYGTGALWDTLHPRTSADTGRVIGHWEGIGNINATGDAMDAQHEQFLLQWIAFRQYVDLLVRVPESVDAMVARANRIAELGAINSQWEVAGSAEGATKPGGMLGAFAALQARVTAVEQHLANLPASGAAYDPGPANAAVAAIQADLAKVHAALAAEHDAFVSAATAAASGGP